MIRIQYMSTCKYVVGVYVRLELAKRYLNEQITKTFNTHIAQATESLDSYSQEQ